MATGLRELGVTRGDRVAGLLPNGPHAVITLLATASIGAIWSSCSPDFGAASVIDRFAQIEPTVLVAVDGYSYGGKEYRRGDVVRQIAAELPGLAAVVLAGPVPDAAAPAARPSPGGVPVLAWDRLGEGRPAPSRTTRRCRSIIRCGCCTPPAPPACPSRSCTGTAAWSWSTSRPCPSTRTWARRRVLLVHHHRLDDVELPGRRPAGRRDAGGLRRQRHLSGHRRAVAVTERERVSYFGVGAPYLLACAQGGPVARARPGHRGAARRRLDRVAAAAEGFHWVYERVRATCCWALLRRHRPVYRFRRALPAAAGRRRGDLLGRCSARRWRPFDPAGQPVIGEVGELVITEPMPSMPVGFWDDPDGTRYAAATSPTSPACGGTATGSRSCPTAGASSTAGPTPRSIAAACGWGPASSTASSRRSGGGGLAWWWTPATLGREGRLRAVRHPRRGPGLTGDLTGRLRRAARQAVAAARAG